MTNSQQSLRLLAAQLAGGPAFLILGDEGLSKLGPLSTQYRWNGVYTSATHPRVAEAFSDETRATSSTGAMTRSPSRSQLDLEIRYLFGGTHLPENERPPATPIEEVTARSRSNQELTRLVTETVTPRGTILIEGWSDGRLRPDDILPLLSHLGDGQAHLFSANRWVSDELVSAFISNGQLVPHPEPLEEILENLVNQGALKVSTESDDKLIKHVIPLGDGFTEIDIFTWNQVRRSARPIDLELLTPPSFGSNAARYQEFRDFIGATEGAPRWRGITSGMNFPRDFEARLWKEVQNQLNERELPKPIILSGQTATGKSIALAALAVELARTGEVSVLHQSRRTVRPSVDDIDQFCAWSAEQGASTTVLVWDGMLDPSEYESFSRQLHARGRKLLVVGSAYRKDSESSLIIPAPAELSVAEINQLGNLLASFGYQISRSQFPIDSSFLAFLYRLLPESEHQLRNGLAREMRTAERVMAELARGREVEATLEQRLTAMQAALRAAGIRVDDLLPAEASDEPIINQSFEERAPIQRVTALVLVAGQHGIPVPIDLALRVLGREGFQSVRNALAATDIIREIEDDDGHYFLSPRSKLEAELLARHEVTLLVEIEVIVQAIRNVRVTDSFLGGADEVEFVVKLLERIGPASDKKSTYERYFGEISMALGDRRAELGFTHPRLVIQESTFARGYVHWQQMNQKSTVKERVTTLEHNRDLLEFVLANSTTRGLLRLPLSVELASTLGAIIHEFAKDSSSELVQGIGSRLNDVLAAVLSARSVDPGSVYPVDVLAWSTRDAVSSGRLTPSERIDHLANAVAVLESLDRNSLSLKQRASLDRRGTQLNHLLGKDDEVWNYLEKLELNSSPAATYFLAQFEAKEGPEGEKKALSRLRQAPASTREDWRCAQLLIDLTWKDITGNRILSGERVPVHLSPKALQRIAQLTRDVGAADLPEGYRFLFVRGIAAFIQGEYFKADELFREAGVMGRQLQKRIRTSYLLADETHKPVAFIGRVETCGPRWGKVWVDKLGARVDFEPKLFSTTGEFEIHQQLGPFNIGFKLSRGAVAEPRRMSRRSERR